MWRLLACLPMLFFSAALAQSPPLLMTPGQQQFLSDPGNCGLNAYSSSDPLTVSIHQVSPNGYLFEALKAGTATITHNCGGQLSSYTLSVQGAEYKIYVCPAEVSSTVPAPEGWTAAQKHTRVFAFTRVALEGDVLSCTYGAGDDVVLSRKVTGRCSISPNKKGAYCQP